MFPCLFLFIQARESSEGEEEIEHTLSCQHTHAGLLHKFLQRLRLGQAEARSLEINQGHPTGWQEPNYQSHYLLLPRDQTNQGLKLHFKPSHFHLGHGHTAVLTIKPNVCSHF